jgi:hypothetical protein
MRNDEVWNYTQPVYSGDKKVLKEELELMVFIKDKGLDGKKGK